MLLIDGAVGYWYSNVYDWKYKKIKKLLKYGKGRVYQYLKKFCKLELKIDHTGKVVKSYADTNVL